MYDIVWFNHSHQSSSAEIESRHKTTIRLYITLVVSVLLHGAETWTLLQSNEQKLEAFHMTCQRRILGVRWNDFVQNTIIVDRTGLDSVLSSIRRRHLAIFGHVRRLPEATPAHVALKLAVDVRSGRTLDDNDNGTQWRRVRRPSGRPQYTWVQQLEADTGLTDDDLWNIASDRDAWRALRPIAGHTDQ